MTTGSPEGLSAWMCLQIRERCVPLLLCTQNDRAWYRGLIDPILLMYLSVCRIGNLLVPNDNYCKFEDWQMPILDQMLLEQNTEVGLYVTIFFQYW